MSLGRFGGAAPVLWRERQGRGASPISDMVEDARAERIPSPEGEPALAGQLARGLFGYGENLLINGSFESWGTGTTSAALTGTVSSSGTTVTGSSTTFQTDFVVGDYILSVNKLHRITAIASDTSLTTAIACDPVLPAGSTYQRVRFSPDGWTLTGAGGTVERDTTSGETQHKFASAKMTAAADTATDLAQSITLSATQNARLRGRTVTLSARVYSATASRVFLRLDDGVKTQDSPQHPGDSAFQTLVVTMTLDSAATKIECSLEISSGASISAIIDMAKLEEGNQATTFVENLRDAFVQPRVVSDSDGVTTTSAAPEELADMYVGNVILDGNQSVIISVMVNSRNNTVPNTNEFHVERDGTKVNSIHLRQRITAADILFGVGFTFIDSKPSAGIYTYRIAWDVTGGTGTCEDRSMSVAVIPSA